MRATDSRTLVLTEVFVPLEHEWIPPGMFDQAALRWPYFYMTLSFAYLGLMRAILDATAEYLIGADGPTERRDHPLKQQGWAAMNLKYDEAQSLCYRVLGEVGVDPSADAVRRAWSSVVSTMEGAQFWPQPLSASVAVVRCCGRLGWSSTTVTPAVVRRCCPGLWRYAWSVSVVAVCTPRRQREYAMALG